MHAVAGISMLKCSNGPKYFLFIFTASDCICVAITYCIQRKTEKTRFSCMLAKTAIIRSVIRQAFTLGYGVAYPDFIGLTLNEMLVLIFFIASSPVWSVIMQFSQLTTF